MRFIDTINKTTSVNNRTDYYQWKDDNYTMAKLFDETIYYVISIYLCLDTINLWTINKSWSYGNREFKILSPNLKEMRIIYEKVNDKNKNKIKTYIINNKLKNQDHEDMTWLISIVLSSNDSN